VNIPGLPLAMLTVWLANTASLLLPVSNLTNLLAFDRIQLSPAAFAIRMAAPQVAAIMTTAVCLWWFYWRRGRRDRDRYTASDLHIPRDRPLALIAAAACTVFVVLVLGRGTVGGLVAGLHRGARHRVLSAGSQRLRMADDPVPAAGSRPRIDPRGADDRSVRAGPAARQRGGCRDGSPWCCTGGHAGRGAVQWDQQPAGLRRR
jgi:hypothetical protein